MSDESLNPLSVEFLKAAAWLCLARAATTDRSQFPPGSGEIVCAHFHNRKDRFRKAVELVRGGTTSLTELGLLSEDCVWAASQVSLLNADLKATWESSFKTAGELLEKAQVVSSA